MKKLVIAALVFIAAISLCTAQNAVQDTTIKPDRQLVKQGEINFGYGGGMYGESFSIGLRYLHYGITLGFTDFKNANAPQYLNYAPPHSDYTVRTYRTASYSITAEYFVPITRHLYVYPSVGAAGIGYKDIPRSNATGWYYSPVAEREDLMFSYGIGACAHIQWMRTSDLTLHLSWRNIIGLTGGIGFAF